MLRSLKDLEGYHVEATDGEVGKVADFLLDDQEWASRYLVVHTGGYFNERDVLISPMFFRKADWTSRSFHLALSQERIKDSPSSDLDLPVSRQHERDYYRYFGYPNYWGSSGIWGMNAAPMGLLPIPAEASFVPGEDEALDDAHLHSAKFIRGYHIQGIDEEIGHLEDMIVDDETWQIRYLVVNTSNWWVGKNVLLSPFWATKVSWETSKLHVALTRKEIKSCPEWDAQAGVNRAYEERLFDYYGRPVYWGQPGASEQPTTPLASSHPPR